MEKLQFVVIEEEKIQKLFESISAISNKLDEMRSNDESQRLLSNDEFCKLAGISKKTSQNLRNRNEIDFIQYGNKIWYKKEDIDSFLDRHYIKKRCRK